MFAYEIGAQLLRELRFTINVLTLQYHQIERYINTTFIKAAWTLH